MAMRLRAKCTSITSWLCSSRFLSSVSVYGPNNASCSLLPAVINQFHSLHQCADVQGLWQDQQHQQITVKKGSGSQTIPSPFDTMSVEFQSFPVKCSEEIPDTGTDAVSEKRRDPVRVKQRRKIFRAQIVLDQGIDNSRCRHHQNRNDPSALTATADPGKSRPAARNKSMYGRIRVSNTETINMAVSLPFVSLFR